MMILMTQSIDMEYIYELLVDGVRRETTSNFVKIENEVSVANRKDNNWQVLVQDGRSFSTIALLKTLDDVAEFRQTLERKYIWPPFNIAEKGIHVKATETMPTNDGQTPTDNNVKTLAAISKTHMSAIPPVAIKALGDAMQNGADKYGLFNWRDTTVTATVFYDAMLRHLLAWYSGEDFADDSALHHLAHLMANCAILLDAKDIGVFNDNRSKGHDPLEPQSWKNKCK